MYGLALPTHFFGLVVASKWGMQVTIIKIRRGDLNMNVLTLMALIILGYWLFAMTLVCKIKSWE